MPDNGKQNNWGTRNAQKVGSEISARQSHNRGGKRRKDSSSGSEESQKGNLRSFFRQ